MKNELGKSLFHFWSYGYVAEDLESGQKIAKIFPTEFTPFYEGSLKPNPRIVEDKGVDAEGKPYTVQTECDDIIEAEWLAIHSTNRMSAPDLRLGERVVIYRYGDVDQFYWVSTGQDDDLRRLETVVWRFSDNTDKSLKVLPLSKCYWVMISTHKGMITIQTSQEQGEPFKHEITIDAASGKFYYHDNVGNEILADSAATLIKFKNADGTLLELNKGDINGKAQNINFEAASTFKVKASTVQIDASTIKTTSSTFTDNGVNVGSKHKHPTAPAGPPSTPV